MLLRPWFSATLPRGFGVGLGYDGLLTWNPVAGQEHRVWQEASHRHDFDRLWTLARFRLEQRFFSDFDRVSVRGRYPLDPLYGRRAKRRHPTLATSEEALALAVPVDAVVGSVVGVSADVLAFEDALLLRLARAPLTDDHIGVVAATEPQHAAKNKKHPWKHFLHQQPSAWTTVY
ncbi:MAG: DUF2490 domain-containing protein [Myxococcales bacterium]|nr:DUF2490 domain-containing protein [Myxococcales bacterium]